MTKQKRQTNESIMEAWEGKTMDPSLHSRPWDIPESIASSHMADLYQTGNQVNTNPSTLKKPLSLPPPPSPFNAIQSTLFCPFT